MLPNSNWVEMVALNSPQLSDIFTTLLFLTGYRLISERTTYNTNYERIYRVNNPILVHLRVFSFPVNP